jgi:hypothetical protein
MAELDDCRSDTGQKLNIKAPCEVIVLAQRFAAARVVLPLMKAGSFSGLKRRIRSFAQTLVLLVSCERA